MKYLAGSAQMKEIDRYTIEEIGIPSLVLMERAAMAVAEEVEKTFSSPLFDKKRDTILAVCGSGNNGADAAAAARMLALKGFQASILLAGQREKCTQEMRRQLEIAGKLEIPVMEYGEFLPGECSVLIDGIFGIGLGRKVEGRYKEVINMMNRLSAKKVIAVDIPSGIHGETGAVMGCAVKADVTVTFGFEKMGTAVYPGREYSGIVKVADIGFPDQSRRQAEEKTGKMAFVLEESDLSLIPRRPAYSNKGTFGKVLIVAGAKNMAGAAYLSALAAYRTGAGLVKVMTPEENRLIIQESLPEAVMISYNAGKIMEDEEERDRFALQIEKECMQASVVVLGPGLGQQPYGKMVVKHVLSSVCSPVIVDADGLNVIAANPELTGYYTENVIITPHLGEMSRLAGKEIREIQEDLAAAAAEYAETYGITCVLKDAATVVADRDGRISVNKSGTSAMAKGGSGDVLTGMIAALIAQGMDEVMAARMGVYLHGLCGEKAAEEKGGYGVLAHEIADQAGKVLKNRG